MMENGKELLQVTLSAVNSLRGPPEKFTQRADETAVFSPLGNQSLNSPSSGTSDSSQTQHTSCSTSLTEIMSASSTVDELVKTSLPFTPTQSAIYVRVPSSMLKEVPSPFESHQLQQTPTPPPALKAHYAVMSTGISDSGLYQKRTNELDRKSPVCKKSLSIVEDHSTSDDSIVVVKPSSLQEDLMKQGRARKALSTFKPNVPAGKVVYPVMVQHNNVSSVENGLCGSHGDTHVRNLAVLITSSATAAAITASKQWLEGTSQSKTKVVPEADKENQRPCKSSIGLQYDPPPKTVDNSAKDVVMEIRGLKNEIKGEVERDRKQIMRKLDQIEAVRGLKPETRPTEKVPHTPAKHDSNNDCTRRGKKNVDRCVVDRVTQTRPETKLNPSELGNQRPIIRSKLGDCIQSPSTTCIYRVSAKLDEVQRTRELVDRNLLWMQRDYEQASLLRALEDSNLASIHTKLEGLQQYLTVECVGEGGMSSAKQSRTLSGTQRTKQPKSMKARLSPSKLTLARKEYEERVYGRSQQSTQSCRPDNTTGKKFQHVKPVNTKEKSQQIRSLPADHLEHPTFNSDLPVHIALPLYPPRIMPSGSSVRHLNQDMIPPVVHPPKGPVHEVSSSNISSRCIQVPTSAGTLTDRHVNCCVQVLPSVNLDSKPPTPETVSSIGSDPSLPFPNLNLVTPRVDVSEYSQFHTIMDVKEDSMVDSDVGSNQGNPAIAIKGRHGVSEGIVVADGATQTHEFPHSPSRGPSDCGWELAQEKMRHMMVAGLTERIQEEILVRVLAEQDHCGDPLGAATCSTCTDPGRDDTSDQGDRKWETIDGRREVDSELLRTLVCDSVLQVVKDAISQHQNQRTAVSRQGQLHDMDYTDDFEGSTSQVVSSAPSTPITTPPSLLQTLVNEMSQEQSRIPSVDTPLLTPVDSADECYIGKSLSREDSCVNSNEVKEQDFGGDDGGLLPVRAVATPQPTDDEDTPQPPASTQSSSSDVEHARGSISHPEVHTPSKTPMSSVDEVPSPPLSEPPATEVIERRDVTLSETTVTSSTSSTSPSKEKEQSSSEVTSTLDQDLSLGEYLIDPVGKKKPVSESGVSFSKGEVPHLPKHWYGPRSVPGDSTRSNEHGILTPQWNPLSTSEDSTSKVDDFSIGEVRRERSLGENLHKRLQKSLSISSPSDSSTPYQGSLSSSDDGSVIRSMGVVDQKQNKSKKFQDRIEPSSDIIRNKSSGEIPKSLHHDISRRSEGEIPSKLRLLLDPPKQAEPLQNGSLGELVQTSKRTHSSKQPFRNGIDVITVRSAKDKVRQKHNATLSLGEVVQTGTNETLGSFDTTAELKDDSTSLTSLHSTPPLLQPWEHSAAVTTPEPQSNPAVGETETISYSDDTFTLVDSSQTGSGEIEKDGKTDQEQSPTATSSLQPLSNHIQNNTSSSHQPSGKPVQNQKIPQNGNFGSSKVNRENPDERLLASSQSESVASSTLPMGEDISEIHDFEPDSLKVTTNSSTSSQTTASEWTF